jgi:hypothetical protein
VPEEKPYLVPNGFLSQVLDEFGLQWTHIAVFSGLVFGTFGLDKYFNSAAWMVTTIIAFSIVFLFRRQVTGRFPVVALLGVLTAAILLLAGYWTAISHSSTHRVTDYLQAHATLATVFLAASTMLPGAFMILSYRRQETLFGGPFPAELRQAILSNLVDLPFYKRRQSYTFRVVAVEAQSIWIELTLSYVVINRTKSEREWTFGLTPSLKKVEVMSARIDNKDLDVDDPEYISERGFLLTREFPPNSEFAVEFVARWQYHITDADIFISYLPTTDFELIVLNPFPALRVVVQSLLAKKAEPEKIQGGVRYKSDGATIPYQGFKLSWMPREAAVNTESSRLGGVPSADKPSV